MSVIIFAALGSIIAGLATPTEAAAMGTFAATCFVLISGRLTSQVVKDASLRTLQTSSLVLFLAVASNVYSSVFTRLGTSTMIANAMLAIPVPPLGLMALVMGVIFVLGWPLEWPAIVLIFLPIFVPVVEGLKFDLVWFSTLVAVNLQTAFPLPSGCDGRVLPQGRGAPVGAVGHLPGHVRLHGPPAHWPGHRVLLSRNRPLAPESSVREISRGDGLGAVEP